jgi:hypothetical protein
VGLVDGGKVLLEENKNMFNAFLCYRIRSSAGLDRYTSMQVTLTLYSSIQIQTIISVVVSQAHSHAFLHEIGITRINDHLLWKTL